MPIKYYLMGLEPTPYFIADIELFWTFATSAEPPRLWVRRRVFNDKSVYRFSCNVFIFSERIWMTILTVLPAKSDSDIMFCLQSY